MNDITEAREAKARENRSRHAAKRRGFQLTKARRFDPLAPDYDLWTIADRNGHVLKSVYGIDAVEAELDRLALAQRQQIGAA